MNRLTTSVLIMLALGAAILYTMYQNIAAQTFALRYTPQELQQKMQEHMPLHKNYQILYGSLDNPQVNFKQGSDKVSLSVDVMIQLQLGSITPLQYKGTLNTASGIRYVPGEGKLYLTEPAIEALALPGLPERFNVPARELLSATLAEFYKERPIYTLKQEDIRESAARMLVKNISVKDNQLIILLGLD